MTDLRARIRGACHCGNVSFELDWGGDPAAIPARACGCGFCVKHGGVWTSHPASALRVAIAEPALVPGYRFGTRTADFHVCGRCGAVPFVSCEIDGARYAVVNVNVFEGVAPDALRRAAADFDGEALDDRLARRRRNWIADVRIETRAPAA